MYIPIYDVGIPTYINQPYSTFHDDRSLEFFYGFLSVPEDFPM